MRVLSVGPPMRRALRGAGVATLLACAGCASEYHPEYHPVSSYTLNQSVSYPTIYEVGGGAPPAVSTSPVVSTPPTDAKPVGVDPSHVLIVESTRLERPGEVIGVVDVPDATGTHDSGLALLRRRAAEMGADAVIGVEFHHDAREGQPTHVSGLAVRFKRTAPGPGRE
ncbi:MAG TPA: hypothetical protein VF316_00330 [Polyangiaceae bacterium]